MLRHLFLLLCTFGICNAGIVFQKEKITATVTACDMLEIQGVYYFVNSDTSAMSTVIYYPFPVDTTLRYPHYISVMRLSDNRPVAYTREKLGISWQQSLLPHSTDSIRVVYRQKTLQTKGRYILTTTQSWNRPLEQAEFSVITPANINLAYWSFQSDSVTMRKGYLTYHSHQKNFFPENDMLLEWTCGK